MKFRGVLLIGFFIVAPPELRSAEDAASKLDMQRILYVTGGKGQFDEEEGVFKVSMPRTDLSVTVGGVRVTPPRYWRIGSTESLAKGLREALVAISAPRGEARATPSHELVIDFERSETGKSPVDFTADLTGKGAAGSWTVVEDETAPRGAKALAQTSDDPAKGRFPLCVYEGVTAKDVAVEVKLRPISGKVDQAGGIVWRYRNRDNYYVARANALEDNVVLYKVENGTRTDLKPLGAGLLAYGKKVEVPARKWSELRIVAKGNRHSVYFDSEHLFDVNDDTFAEPGRVGLWTKADSVTRFDELVIESLGGGSQGPRR